MDTAIKKKKKALNRNEKSEAQSHLINSATDRAISLVYFTKSPCVANKFCNSLKNVCLLSAQVHANKQ